MNFTYTEYVTDISSTINFTNTRNACSPVNPSLFPMLSQVANQFELYKFNSLKFVYKSKLSNASNTAITQLGTVGFVMVYDSTRPPISSKMEGNNYQGATSCRADRNMQCFVAVDDIVRYTRPKGIAVFNAFQLSANTNDPRNELQGALNIYTEGQAADGVRLGELWVEYNCDFFRPKLNMTIGGGYLGARIYTVSNELSDATNAVVFGRAAGVGAAGAVVTPYFGVYVNNVNFSFPSFNQMEFDIQDGQVVIVDLKYTSPTYIATQEEAFELSNVDAVFQAYEPDQDTNGGFFTNQLVSTSGNIVKTTQPQVWRFITPGPAAAPATGFRGWTTITFTMTIKARQSGRCRLTNGLWNPGTSTFTPHTIAGQIGFGYDNLQIEVRVLDRVSSFPANTVNSISNPTWLT